MKIVKSVSKNVRGSAKKARIPARVVRGMKIDYALSVLESISKKASGDVYKVVKAAAADAVHNFEMKYDSLVIYNIRVDKAFGLKRFKSGSRGMVKPIKKHYCHIMVELIDQSDTDLKKDEKSNKKEVKVEKKSERIKGTSKAKSTKKIKNTKTKSD